MFFAFLVILCGKRKKPQKVQNPVSTTTTTTTTELFSTITVNNSASFDPALQISMTKLRRATKNFSSDFIIGSGRFGLIYKAQLSNGVTVAIKRLDPDAFKGSQEFWAEMVTLGMLHHPNIVKILGYCMTDSNRLLIYEFIQNGSLDQRLHLQEEEKQDVATLSWVNRIQIVRGVANGLSFLHGLDKPIAHQDIKSSNVLLDSDLQAHISDFGLARRIDASTSYASSQSQSTGTMGYSYKPPEYKDGLTVPTLEADVYSFGVLMFEIATGKRPNLPNFLDGKEVGLVDWARNMLFKNQHMEMVDAYISREDGLIQVQVKEYFEIAGMCTCEIRRCRPTMPEVVQWLNRIPTCNF